MKTASPLLLASAAFAALSSAVCADVEKAKAYELKNRSAFHLTGDVRIPFWPIGFQRPKIKADGTASAPVVVASKIKLAPENFSVTSILMGNPALATINGRSFEEGELLPVIYGAERLRVVVRAIRDGGVTLEYEGQHVLVPMKRMEVGKKNSEKKADAVAFVIKIGPQEK